MPVANCKITGITRNTDNERISVCHARSFVRWQLHTGNTGNRRLALSMTDQLSRPERASILARNPSFESRSFAKVGKKTHLCMYVILSHHRAIHNDSNDFIIYFPKVSTGYFYHCIKGLTLFRDSFSEGIDPRREVEQGRRCARRLIEWNMDGGRYPRYNRELNTIRGRGKGFNFTWCSGISRRICCRILKEMAPFSMLDEN